MNLPVSKYCYSLSLKYPEPPGGLEFRCAWSWVRFPVKASSCTQRRDGKMSSSQLKQKWRLLAANTTIIGYGAHCTSQTIVLLHKAARCAYDQHGLLNKVFFSFWTYTKMLLTKEVNKRDVLVFLALVNIVSYVIF